MALPSEWRDGPVRLPALGHCRLEPVPGGWLVQLGGDGAGTAPTRAVLDVRAPRVRSDGHGRERRVAYPMIPRHAEMLYVLACHREGRSAAQLSLDLFGDSERTVTVRAEMSRLRRQLGTDRSYGRTTILVPSWIRWLPRGRLDYFHAGAGTGWRDVMTTTVTRGAPEEERAARSGLGGLLDLPADAARGITRSAATTPGRLTLVAAGLIALSLLTGLVGTLAVQDRGNTIDGLIDHREPLAAAAQEVYRSLSDADATASSAFLSTGAEPAELRERYRFDIAKAGAALAKAASDSAGVPEAAEQVGILSRQLPVYTGLVETARANNRQGFPAGAAYLREASELMRSTILPAAQELYEIDTERLVEEQDDATGVPWFTALLVLALIGALVATQIYLKRRTNRVFNVGLLVATVAVGIVVLWSAVSLTVQSVLVSSGREDGTEQVDVLVRARIAALQARADETLTLVARGGGSEYEKEFGALAGQLAGGDGKGGLLAEAAERASGLPSAGDVDAARQSTTAWLRAHAEVRKLDDSGEYEQAVQLAIDTSNPESAASAFTRLDEKLAAAIGAGRQIFLDDTTNGARALTLLAPGIAVLTVIAALGATLGIRERLREYR